MAINVSPSQRNNPFFAATMVPVGGVVSVGAQAASYLFEVFAIALIACADGILGSDEVTDSGTQKDAAVERADSGFPRCIPEICANQADDNCNDIIDAEQCYNPEPCKISEIGATREYYTGQPPETKNQGICRPGIEVCRGEPDGVVAHYVRTTFEVTPLPETCDGLDNDCDGSINNGLITVSYSGPDATRGVGVCRPRIQECADGNYVVKQEEILPSIEICNGFDDNCNRSTDEGLTISTYSGPDGTEGIGACHPRIEECISGDNLITQEEGLPSTESCNSLDDDCDGAIDEGLTLTTYSGPEGTEGVGICRSEIRVCESGISVITQSQVLPQEENCNTLDDDCNSEVDDPAIICTCDPDGNGIITEMFTDAIFLISLREFLGRGASEDITLLDALSTTHLEIINIDRSSPSRNFENINGIECFTNLTHIQLYGNQVSNLAPLSSLTSLTNLYLGLNQISDLTPLSGLTNLAQLDIYNNQVSDLTPLSGLTNLYDLSLMLNQISDLSPLSGLTNLVDLALNYNQIFDLTPLSELTNLNQLRLGFNQISDLTPLSELTNLNQLRLDVNQISDLAPISTLTNLFWARFDNNPISDLAPLSGLIDLTSLTLDCDQISDLTPLSGLINLEILSIINNQIADISPLMALPALDTVCLSDNPIPSEQIDTIRSIGVEICSSFVGCQ